MVEKLNITDLAMVAAEIQKADARLWTGTELAGVPATEENERVAVGAVNYLTAQTRAMLRFSAEQRGMFLVWLKRNKTGHGEWEAFCEKYFPDIPKSSRCRWMQEYLIATGEKRPVKRLRARLDDELESEEMIDAHFDPRASGEAKMPRGALVAHCEKQRKQIQKGQEQRQKDREAMEKLREEVERLKAGAAIPPEIKTEAERVEFVRNAFWQFVTTWISALPDSASRARLHHALYDDLKETWEDLWPEYLGPQLERKIAAAREGA